MYSTAKIPFVARNAWHAAGLRWIGSLFSSLADYLERPAVQAVAPPRKHGDMLPAEDFLDDVKLRIRSRCF